MITEDFKNHVTKFESEGEVFIQVTLWKISRVRKNFNENKSKLQ